MFWRVPQPSDQLVWAEAGVGGSRSSSGSTSLHRHSRWIGTELYRRKLMAVNYRVSVRLGASRRPDKTLRDSAKGAEVVYTRDSKLPAYVVLGDPDGLPVDDERSRPSGLLALYHFRVVGGLPALFSTTAWTGEPPTTRKSTPMAESRKLSVDARNLTNFLWCTTGVSHTLDSPNDSRHRTRVIW